MNDDSHQYLIKLIQLYNFEVEKYVSLLKKEYDSNDIIQDLKAKKIPRKGKILKDIEFEFHGIGCRFDLPNDKHIDFDFGNEGRYDGFDLGWLENFLDENCLKNFPRYFDALQLKKDFEELEKAKIIIKSGFPHDSLYYLAEKL